MNLQQAIDAREKTRRGYELKLEQSRKAKLAAERRKLAQAELEVRATRLFPKL